MWRLGPIRPGTAASATADSAAATDASASTATTARNFRERGRGRRGKSTAEPNRWAAPESTGTGVRVLTAATVHHPQRGQTPYRARARVDARTRTLAGRDRGPLLAHYCE